MRLRDCLGKQLVIWGLGMEGQAAARMIRAAAPDQPLIFIDENPQATLPPEFAQDQLVTAPEAIAQTLQDAEIIVKSPGVSLYHPLLAKAREKGAVVTSLLNLWMAENPKACVIGITGTKGKSTTASLLTHTLQKLGKTAVLVGNFGVAVTDGAAQKADYVVLEVSSYQAANFDGACAVGVMTCLYPEHLDWHGSVAHYVRDKAQLIAHSAAKLLSAQAAQALKLHGLAWNDAQTFDEAQSFEVTEGGVFESGHRLGVLDNAYLLRAHNRKNVCAVLAVIKALALDRGQALLAMADYRGLPHRQQEIGTRDGVLYVDDSISTTPQSTIAALEVYRDRAVTLIAGGQDRGVDMTPLTSYLSARPDCRVVCLGESGPRLQKEIDGAALAGSMQEAVRIAQAMTPSGGVILLSPAAPSYDMFKNYIARAQAFIDAAGIASV